MNDLVSVIIPTYNRSQFVTEAIDSVLHQTYPNIELIVVNDGSTDDTEQKLQPYLGNIIYEWQENQGPGPAVNTGLRVAKGKYIARLDDDDLFTPDKIEKQVKVFGENPDVGLVTSGCFITDSIGRIISVQKAPDFSEYGPFLSFILDYNLLQPTVMVRRECHDHAKVGLYKNTYAQEFNIFLRISRYWKVWVIDQPLALHRRHSGNRTVDSYKNEELKRDISGFICDVLADVSLEELFPAVRSTSLPYRWSCAYAARGALYLRHRVSDKADADFYRALDLCPTNPIPLV
jgi:glycosyltransferase involved in cell wall biosynthesis